MTSINIFQVYFVFLSFAKKHTPLQHSISLSEAFIIPHSFISAVALDISPRDNTNQAIMNREESRKKRMKQQTLLSCCFVIRIVITDKKST